MFIIYDDKGAITQALQGPDPETYGASLTAMGVHWLFNPKLTGVDITGTYVRAGKIVRKPALRLKMNGRKIRADNQAAVHIRGIPPGASVRILVNGRDHRHLTVDDGELDICSSVPAIYTVIVSAWPFRNWTKDIEVVP
jgi:hypothetical protein